MCSAVLKIFHALPGEKPVFGTTRGICRITGLHSVGVPFHKWVPDTFTDYGFLKPGDIVSNEAAYFFAEKNEHLQKIVKKDTPQKVRSYSVLLHDNMVHFCTKADKKKMYELVLSGAEIVCLAESGQKHIVFKHRENFWQLEEINNITPNVDLLRKLMEAAHRLIFLGFTQTECISGIYATYKLLKQDNVRAAFDVFQECEALLSKHRGSAFFDFFSFLLFKP